MDAVLFYYSVTLIPMSLHTILLQTSPLFTSLLAYFFNGERMLLLEKGAMVVCFTAVVAMTLGE